MNGSYWWIAKSPRSNFFYFYEFVSRLLPHYGLMSPRLRNHGFATGSGAISCIFEVVIKEQVAKQRDVICCHNWIGQR